MKKIISHENYRNAITELIEVIKGRGVIFDKVYGVPRGGYYPATVIAQAAKVPVILDATKIDADTLVVDDLIDSGKTVGEFQNKHPEAKYATVFCKTNHLLCDTSSICCGVQVEQDDWLVFPDEHDGEDIEGNFRRTLQFIGEDTTREGLLETPSRMRRAYEEIFSGYKIDPWSLVKTFTKGTCEEMVILRNSEFYSTCEHHFFPFFGHCSIGYIPNGKVIGVSKLARLLDCFSKRMQIQERMTSQIADFLVEALEPKGVYVVAEGVHFCMTSRGIKKQDASMITSAVRGVFRDSAQARNEFLHLIGK